MRSHSIGTDYSELTIVIYEYFLNPQLLVCSQFLMGWKIWVISTTPDSAILPIAPLLLCDSISVHNNSYSRLTMRGLQEVALYNVILQVVSWGHWIRAVNSKKIKSSAVTQSEEKLCFMRCLILFFLFCMVFFTGPMHRLVHSWPTFGRHAFLSSTMISILYSNKHSS